MNERRQVDHWFTEHLDVIAVFSLGVVPALVDSTLLANSESGEGGQLHTMLWQLIVRSFQVSIPILLIMRLRNIDWISYGFRQIRPITDFLTAFGLVALSYALHYTVAVTLLNSGIDISGDEDVIEEVTTSQGAGLFSFSLIIAASVANGFAEELVMRSYLITRIGQLSGSTNIAAVLTTLLFASYHSYQGQMGMLSALLIGGVLAGYFVKSRRFWPVCIAHALMDFIPFTLLLVEG